MHPSLAITYNSSSVGTGPLGVGWSMSGFPLSQITRCKTTQAIDGEDGPVSFTGSAYCLDGDRLIPVVSGSSEYRTERDQFAKIVRSGTATNPTGFKVYSRDGKILSYGSRANNRLFGNQVSWSASNSTIDPPFPVVTTSPSVTYAWALDTVEDRTAPYHSSGKGNLVKIDYQLSSGSCARYPTSFGFAEFVPTTIQYGYDTTSTTPTRKLTFTYVDPAPSSPTNPGRRDIQCSFVNGLGIKSTKQLTQIDVSGPNPSTLQVLRSYKLKYDVGGVAPVTGRTRLSSVQECDQFGVCKAPTRFEYEPGTSRFKDHNLPVAPSHLPWAWRAGDVDGDGKDDLIYALTNAPVGVDAPYPMVYRRSTGSGFEVERAWPSPVTGERFFTTEVADFNADGMADLTAQHGVDRHDGNPKTSWAFFLATRTGFTELPPSTNDTVAPPFPAYLGDLDGDGVLDLTQVLPWVNNPICCGPTCAAAGRVCGRLSALAFRRNSVDAQFAYHLGPQTLLRPSATSQYVTVGADNAGSGLSWRATSPPSTAVADRRCCSVTPPSTPASPAVLRPSGRATAPCISPVPDSSGRR